MGDELHQEYDDELTELLSALWGEGFLSPGGTAEVDRFLSGVDLEDKKVLDIGCGTGGVDVHIANTNSIRHLLGIDVDASLIAADGRIYAVSEGGAVSIVAAADTFELLGRCELNERCLATPAIVCFPRSAALVATVLVEGGSSV